MKVCSISGRSFVIIGSSETTLNESLGAKLQSVKDEHFYVVQILEELILKFRSKAETRARQKIKIFKLNRRWYVLY